MPATTAGGPRSDGRALWVSNLGIEPSSIINEEAGMPAKRELTMRQLRYMLRLHHDGVSAREIGRTLGVARARSRTICGGRRRAASVGLCRPS